MPDKTVYEDDKCAAPQLESANHPDPKQLVMRFIKLRNPRDGKKTCYANESEYEDDTLLVWPESGWFLRGLLGLLQQGCHTSIS